MGMKLHYSPNYQDWMECRAREGNCPFGNHGGLQQVIADVVRRNERGESLPSVRTTAGTVRTVAIDEDGAIRIGDRLYSEEGLPILTASTMRGRKHRARMRALAKPVLTIAEKLAWAEQRAWDLIRANGLRKTVFKWNRRTRSLGVTKWRRGQQEAHSVELSKVWAESLPVEEIEDTLTHELAHALVGPHHGHDAVWQAKHRELGGNGKACYDGSHGAQLAWQGTCPACGHTVSSLTPPKAVQACGKCCDGVFRLEFAFEWTKHGSRMAHEAMGKAYRSNWEWLVAKYGNAA